MTKNVKLHNAEAAAAQTEQGSRSHLVARADEPFKASAFRKVAQAINNYPEKITSSKQVGHVKGIGKGSMLKVSNHLLRHRYETAPQVQAAAQACKAAKIGIALAWEWVIVQ